MGIDQSLGLSGGAMPRAGYAEWDEEDLADWVDERPARRLKRKRPSWLRVILMSSCIIAGLAYLALQQEPTGRPAGRSTEIPSSVLVAPAPAWRPAAPSPARYALAGAPGSVATEARQHTDGAREDTLVLGRFGDFRYAHPFERQKSVQNLWGEHHVAR